MRKLAIVGIAVWLTCWCVLSLCFNSPAYAEKIPALSEIPAGLSPEAHTRLSQQKQALEKELADFQAAAAVFNAKDAKDQSDAEYTSLDEWRTRYINAAKAFNREVADAVSAFQKGEATEKERRLLWEKINKLVSADQQRYRHQLDALMWEAKHLQPQSPAGPRTIHEGIMLGLFDPQKTAVEKYAGFKSPFSGKPYLPEEVFATTDSNDASEALRGLLDNHYFGAYTLNTAYGKKLIAKLQGTHFERLVAHSNGATIAEALIRAHVITVDELNVVGGDRCMVNKFGLQELIASGSVTRVVVWTNPGDVIPMGSSSTLLSPFGPTGSLPVATTALYFSEVLMGAQGRRHAGGGSLSNRFQIRRAGDAPRQLRRPQLKGLFSEHGEIFE